MTSYSAARRTPPLRRVAYYGRVLRVLAAIDFKMKYAQSAMGYVWSLTKPLAYFSVLWLVFGHFFKVPGGTVENFALFLIVGLVVYLFFIDAIGMALPAIAAKGTLLRRLRFSPIVLPVSATITGLMTFAINSIAVAFFVAVSGVTPNVRWLLIPLLVLELYAFVVGFALIVSALFVQFRDVAQLWELASQLMIFLTPVMYSPGVFPEWAQRVVFVNPLVQVMQDLRSVILPEEQLTTASVYGPLGYLLPLSVVALTVLAGVLLLWRNGPRFAERI